MRKHAQIVTELLDDLPNGFTYVKGSSDFNETSLSKDKVRAGDFVIEIDAISMHDLVRMRKLLPRELYQSIKNRKSSRLIRNKKKIASQEMDH